MPQVTFQNVPVELIQAYCDRYGYTGSQADSAAKLAFFKQTTINVHWKANYKEHVTNTAAAAAAKTAGDSADTISIT